MISFIRLGSFSASVAVSDGGVYQDREMLLFVPRASDETLICGPVLASPLEEFLERTRQEFLSDQMMRSLNISCFS